MIISSIACSNLLCSSVNWAYISNHVRNYAILSVWSMLVVYDNPWNISVSWNQLFSCNCIIHNILDSLCSSGTSLDAVPINSILSSTFFSLSIPVWTICLETNNHGKSLSIEIIFLDNTRFNQVSFTFSISVLASKSPAGSILNSSSISIWIKIEVANFPEILW